MGCDYHGAPVDGGTTASWQARRDKQSAHELTNASPRWESIVWRHVIGRNRTRRVRTSCSRSGRQNLDRTKKTCEGRMPNDGEKRRVGVYQLVRTRAHTGGLVFSCGGDEFQVYFAGRKTIHCYQTGASPENKQKTDLALVIFSFKKQACSWHCRREVGRDARGGGGQLHEKLKAAQTKKVGRFSARFVKVSFPANAATQASMPVSFDRTNSNTKNANGTAAFRLSEDSPLSQTRCFPRISPSLWYVNPTFL